VVFFIGLMASMTVYLGKWAVTLAPTLDQREPSYLFQWAPTSFGWRDLLLHKSPHPTAEYHIPVNWHNNIGTFFVSLWLYLFFLLVVGFGYSYFWAASTIIYLLMRQKVDDTEMDEIHMEEEPEPFPAPSPSGTSSLDPAKPNQTAPQMVESPQLRTAAPAPPTMAAAPSQPASPPSAEPAKDVPRPEGAT
jgi:hypothetical protein